MIGLYLSGLVLTNATPLAFLCFIAFAIRWIGRNTNTYGLALGLLALAISVLAVMVTLRWLSTLRNLEMDQRQRRGKQQAGLAASAATLATVAGLMWLAINFQSVKSEADSLLKGISVASAVGLVVGLIKSENKLLKSLLPFIFCIAWVALIPVLFAWCLRFLTESEALGYAPLNVPILILVGIGLMILSVFANTDRISLHHFYRDRLSEAYVIKRVKKGDAPDETIVSNESLSLAKFHAQPNGAPYHLINTTLNVPDTRDRYLRGRGADFFMFSKFYCGAESTGYRRTDRYENGETRLATAVAVSGAAASSQMGTSTSPILRFFLILLNIRLNRWMPNPDPRRMPFLSFWPYYFVKELLGKERETDGLLNLSDGGHHENLGVYPL